MQACDMGSSLLDVDHLKAICALEEEFVRLHFTDGCPAHSLPYYITQHSNKSCSQLSQEDVQGVVELLQSCAAVYFSGNLSKCHTNSACSGIPVQCLRYQVVHKIFTFLTDVNFMKDGDVNQLKVTYSQIIFRSEWLDPNKQLSDVRDFYLSHLDNVQVISSDGLVESVAMDMLIEILVFNDYVISDLPYYALAMVLVLFVIILYMRSVVLTMVILLVVAFTLLVGYFFYFVVFRFPFFPFINILAGLLCIAVGADDVFILRDIWNSFLINEEGVVNDLEKVVSMTLKHGALSIFVTSLTTAAALYANYVSDITSLKCFSVFAGTCILLNFYFMITFVPPIMVLLFKCNVNCFRRCDVTAAANKVWGKAFPIVIIKPRYLWLLVFLAMGIGGLVLVFFKPTFSLPTSKDMKIFYPEHHFEVYRDKMRDEFRFEVDLQKVLEYDINIQFVWGLRAEDTGNWIDPKDNGTLLYDEQFDMYSEAGQIWMNNFCKNLLDQDFIVSPARTECFFERFQKTVTSSCNATSINTQPCCDLQFPLNHTMAKLCLHSPLVLTSLSLSAEAERKAVLGMPIYETGGKALTAFTFFLPTTRTWTTLYNTMDDFYNSVESFVAEQMKLAPEGVNGGWWCGARGDLFYYNLQSSLAGGTYVGMGVSLAVGCVVLLFTSMNILITIYAMVSITLTIATTVGILVLLGWELGFFESITITLAVGLSIDFTIHYGVAYLLSVEEDRHSRVKESLVKVGSAVAMAALTTFVAGAAIMGGRVLGYRNFGVFLMVVMTVSWAFATFFFLSLCACIGPLGNCGNLTYIIKCICCRKRSRQNVSKTSSGIRLSGVTNGQVIVIPNGKLRNSFEGVGGAPRNSFSRPAYFQPLNDDPSLKEISRPSRLANHNMNSNESIFNCNENNNSDNGGSSSRRPPSSAVSEGDVDIVWRQNDGETGKLMSHSSSNEFVL